MTTTYYIPPDHISGNKAVLPAEEVKHAVQVLRHNAGDEIIGVDGAGGWYRIVLSDVTKRNVVGDVVEIKQNVGESDFELTIAFGLLKNQKRVEVFVEKACELGVTRIIPLKTRRTEKHKLRLDRLNKILIAAMKQCGRSKMVEVTEAHGFSEVLTLDEAAFGLICHESIDPENSLLKVIGQNKTKNYLVLVGPEGGFSEEEVGQALEAGMLPVSLGTRRLRAETAAITACAGISLFNTTV